MLQRLDRFRKGGPVLAPTPVASQDVIDWPAVVDAWQILGETDPTECPAACVVSTWRPSTRRTYTSHLRRFAQLGGAVQPGDMQTLAEKVLLSMFAQGQQAAAARGCISALKAVATLGWIPPLQWDRLWRISKAAVDSTGHRQFGGPTYSSSWPNHAPGWESGKVMAQWSCPSPRYAEWEKYHRFADRTSPRWESRTRGSNETIARSRDDWGHTRRHGLRGSARSPLVRRQRWDEQQTSKWVWPSSCRGPTEERPGGMPGGERAQATSVGWDFRGGTSRGGVGGIASKLLTCMRLPPTHLNVCRLRDCLGQPLKESAGRKPISGTCGRPASWSSSKMTRRSEHPRQRPRGHDSREETAGPKRRAPQRNGRSAQGAKREEAANPDARFWRESQRRGLQQTSSLPGARGPWTRCRHGVGLTADHQKPRLLQGRVPSTSMRNRTRRWVPRSSVTPMEEQQPPDSLEGVDGSKDDPEVSRRGGHGPKPQRVSEPSTWQRWLDVQPAAPVNNECPRERVVERLIRSERGRGWVDEISAGLRLSGGLRDLLHRRIRFLFIQGGRVARDLGMVDIDDQLIAALDSLRGDVWSRVLRASTSPVTLLLSLDPSALDRGLGPVGNIPIPEFLWHFLAPLDFQDVTARDLGQMPEISPEGLIMARALVRDGVLRQCAEGGGGPLGPNGYLFPIPKNAVTASMIVHLVRPNKCHRFSPPSFSLPSVEDLAFLIQPHSIGLPRLSQGSHCVDHLNDPFLSFVSLKVCVFWRNQVLPSWPVTLT